MPVFYFHFHDGRTASPDDIGLEYPGLEAAYLAICASIPEMAKELLIKRQDPLAASYTIADAKGRTLMAVPFTDILTSPEWRLAKARRRPHGGPRSAATRNRLAQTSFRRMFGAANAGCVLLTPEMRIIEMNEFGAQHSHVDADAIRGMSIYETFEDLKGDPKSNFDQFMSLAQAGAASEVVDLPYLVLDQHGQTANGWWNARTWPIFDDDNSLLGFVDWAEPYTAPTHGGATTVRIAKKA